MLWEMGIQSINGDVPKKEKEIVKWVDSAHKYHTAGIYH